MTDRVPNAGERRAYYQSLGERIAALRTEREWTQAEVAGMVQVSQQTILAYEQGDRNLPLDRAVQLAKVFNVSLMQLLGVHPVPPLERERISPRMVRHVQVLKRLSASDQLHIIELTKSVAKQSSQPARHPSKASHPRE